jgi:hypothetical protein
MFILADHKCILISFHRDMTCASRLREVSAAVDVGQFSRVGIRDQRGSSMAPPCSWRFL